MNDGVRKLAGKRRAFEEWLRRSDTDSCDRYPAPRAVVKLAVKVSKRMPDWRLGERS